MGKRSLIKDMITLVTLISYHKILHKKGTKLEAKKYLQDEIENYTDQGLKSSQDIRFNETEIEEIKEKSIQRTINTLKNNYPDVEFTEKEAKEMVIATMEELFK